MYGILILADITPVISFHAVVVLSLGKDLFI